LDGFGDVQFVSEELKFVEEGELRGQLDLIGQLL